MARRPAERAFVVLGFLAAAAKVAADAGAPAWIFTAAAVLAAAAAVLAAFSRGPGWLDAWRLPIVLLGLWQLGSVYPRLGGDGFEYYVLARSPLFDGDLDLANDFAGLGARPIFSPLGQVTSRVPLGMALVFLPAIVLAHVATSAAFILGSSVPADGFSAAYLSAATATTFAIGLCGVVLLDVVLRRFYPPAVALLCSLALWWATPLHFYMVANPFMSHAASAGLATLFVALWLRGRASARERDWAVLGLVGTLLTLVRVQDGVLLALPVLDLFLDRRARPLRWRLLAAFSAAAVLGALVQGLVWARLWSPGFIRIILTQGPGFSLDLRWLDVLLSPRHGLFTWTPLYVFAVAGWLLWIRRERRLALYCAGAFAAAVLVNSSMGDWWGSDAFGQRRLLGLTPLFGLGLGEAVAFARRRPLVPVAVAFAVLVLWNQQLAYIYNSELVARKGQAMTLDRVAAAQVDVLYRGLVGADWLPPAVWVLAYDNLKGLWLDEGPRSLRGTLDLGAEPEDLPMAVGDGWYAPSIEEGATVRESRGPRSQLVVPIRTPSDFYAVLRARSNVPARPVGVTLSVNGQRVGEVEAAPSWGELRFAVPAGLVRPGFNRLTLHYSTTPRAAVPGYGGRNAALVVDWLRFERRLPEPAKPAS